MAVPKKTSPDVTPDITPDVTTDLSSTPSTETVQLRSLADVTMYLGHKSSIDFIGGSAVVTTEIAAKLRDLGHID